MSKNQELPHSQNYHKQHPTDFIHGLLSSHVYTDSKERDIVQFIADINNADHQYNNSQYNELLKDWRVQKIYSNPVADNYYGVLYVNDTAKQAVLAHRGTDIIASLKGQNGSLKADLIEVLNGNIVLQQTEAYTSTKDAVDIVNDKQYNLSFTGHSLGAWLAELSLYFCHMDFSYDISVGYVKAVTFDSPGTKNQMESYKSSINNKDTKIEISEFDVVTYLSAPNLVNVCNEHVGKVYRLFPEISPQSEIFVKVAEKLPSYISNNKVYLDALLAISGHSLDPMLATFDSSTGTPKPTHYREVLN
ncbi:MAG: hypothetical protein LN569_04930 [Rickettsia endosymbiont of Labidopullus appendiculatus]|nr:hypothetical protein [Rickettsia endosymbiont of Labidopullus appendiculatus]